MMASSVNLRSLRKGLLAGNANGACNTTSVCAQGHGRYVFMYTSGLRGAGDRGSAVRPVAVCGTFVHRAMSEGACQRMCQWGGERKRATQKHDFIYSVLTSTSGLPFAPYRVRVA